MRKPPKIDWVNVGVLLAMSLGGYLTGRVIGAFLLWAYHAMKAL